MTPSTLQTTLCLVCWIRGAVTLSLDGVGSGTAFNDTEEIMASWFESIHAWVLLHRILMMDSWEWLTEPSQDSLEERRTSIVESESHLFIKWWYVV